PLSSEPCAAKKQRRDQRENRRHAERARDGAGGERDEGLAAVQHRGANTYRLALAPGRRGFVGSAMMTGCDAPRPKPRTNDSAISSGTLCTNGKRKYAVPATVIALAISNHWCTCRTSCVSTARTTNVATAKQDITTPIVPGASPMREP